MSDPQEDLLLAEMRTLLAFERNYLAENRTELAEFRAGIAILAFTTPISLIFTTEFPFLSVLAIIILYIGLGILFVIGIGWIVHSQLNLRKIRAKILIIKRNEKQLIDKSPILHTLLGDIINNWNY